MNILSYKIFNLLNTSIKIEDLGITLQSRGGQDGVCTISSDSYNRSSSLKDLLNKKWVSAQPVHTVVTNSHVPTRVPQASPPDDSLRDSNAVSIQNDIRALNSKFDEMLAAFRTASQTPAPAPAPAPVYIQVPMQTGSYTPGQHQTHISSQPDNPIFIPSSIVPKGADVHISSNEESSAVEDFEDSLAALKAARKKKV